MTLSRSQCVCSIKQLTLMYRHSTAITDNQRTRHGEMIRCWLSLTGPRLKHLQWNNWLCLYNWLHLHKGLHWQTLSALKTQNSVWCDAVTTPEKRKMSRLSWLLSHISGTLPKERTTSRSLSIIWLFGKSSHPYITILDLPVLLLALK